MMIIPRIALLLAIELVAGGEFLNLFPITTYTRSLPHVNISEMTAFSSRFVNCLTVRKHHIQKLFLKMYQCSYVHLSDLVVVFLVILYEYIIMYNIGFC